MPYVPFCKYFPEVAERETRAFTVMRNSELPSGTYSLVEMYCDERGCDCRRVFFSVISSVTKKMEAVIAFGWESPKFYEKWFGDNDPAVIHELKGPALNTASPQSRNAPAILKTVENVVLCDTKYIDRLKRHYKMFRDRVENKNRGRKA
jgi:hypothetical protein